MLKLFKVPMKRNCFVAYFKVYLSKLEIQNLRFSRLKFRILQAFDVRLFCPHCWKCGWREVRRWKGEVVIALLEKRTSRAVKIQTKRQELGCTSSLLIHLLEQSVCNSSAAIITISKIHLFSTCFCARRVSMNPVGKENCRLFLAQRNWKCVFTRAACKEILELFFKYNNNN